MLKRIVVNMPAKMMLKTISGSRSVSAADEIKLSVKSNQEEVVQYRRNGWRPTFGSDEFALLRQRFGGLCIKCADARLNDVDDHQADEHGQDD